MYLDGWNSSIPGIPCSLLYGPAKKAHKTVHGRQRRVIGNTYADSAGAGVKKGSGAENLSGECRAPFLTGFLHPCLALPERIDAGEDFSCNCENGWLIEDVQVIENFYRDGYCCNMMENSYDYKKPGQPD